MKLSVNWLTDYIPLSVGNPQELLETITLGVCEVEKIQSAGEALRHIICAQIAEVSPHPDACNLSVVKIYLGDKRYKTVVCGAQNFKVGDKVAFAPPGSVLPDGTALERKKIRGMQSDGMLCSERELDVSDEHEGLMILEADAEIGKSISDILPDLLDYVLEIDNKSITHRPDLWGHMGFARELSALFKLPFEVVPNTEKLDGPGIPLLRVSIDPQAEIPRFSGLSVENVRVKKSPSWLRYRLHRIGLRAINNLIDITNYVMSDRGQPMHIFDAEQVVDRKLEIKCAAQGDEIMTLYKKKVALNEKDVVIFDGAGPTAIAGIIGGLRSGVNADTEKVYLEAGNWNSTCVRRSSMRMGIRTDASQRYEKSLDPQMTLASIADAVKLLRITCPDLQIRGSLFDERKDPPYQPLIDYSPDFAAQRLGKDISAEEQFDILTGLGFEITDKGKTWSVKVPTWRSTKDISLREDLIEEVGRIINYNTIQPNPPLFPIEKPNFNRKLLFERKAKLFAAHNGFHEVYLYPLTNEADEIRFGIRNPKPLPLINAVSEKQNLLRYSALPQLVVCVSDNQKHHQEFSLFESGRSYGADGSGASEKRSFWLARSSDPSGGATMDSSYSNMADTVRKLLKDLRVAPADVRPVQNVPSYMHPHASAEISVSSVLVGKMFCLHLRVVRDNNLKGIVFFAELDMDALYAIGDNDYFYRSIPKFPPVFFDVSVLADKRQPFEDIKKVILSVDKLVSEVYFKDEFYPENRVDKKSVTISVVFRSDKTTIASDDVTRLQNRVIQELEQAGYFLKI